MQSNQISSTGAVLIVDDEQEIVNILVECATRAGVKAFGVTSTSEAEVVLSSEDVFFLSLDFRMPEEDGLSFYERIKESGRCIPAVLITANADPLTVSRASKLGVDKIIRKPFKTSEIVAMFKEYQERRNVLTSKVVNS